MTRLLPQFGLPDPKLGQISLEPIAGGSTVWLEIGFGGGEHLAAQAAAHPQTLLLGAEPFQNGVASALSRLHDESLSNVRIHMGDVRDLLEALPAASLDRIFVLFPDPWPKARHTKRRLINASSIERLARVLKQGGRLRFATDWADYGEKTLSAFLANPAFSWAARRADDWRRPPDDHSTTRYEAKGLGDIRPVFLDFLRL